MLIWFPFNKNCKPPWDDRWYVRYIKVDIIIIIIIIITRADTSTRELKNTSQVLLAYISRTAIKT